MWRHISDRLGRAVCGSTTGITEQYLLWGWREKKHACMKCYEIYKRRKSAFIQSKFAQETL